jgi:hypothetical protein
MKLLEHISEKKKKVGAVEWVSNGLGGFGTLLFFACGAQLGHPVNAIRLPVAFGFLVASVVIEHASDDAVEALEKAQNYYNEFQKDYIRRDTVRHGLARDIELADETYASIPEDRWEEAQMRLGMAPPNFNARQPREVVQQLAEPPIQTKLDEIEDVDPAADFEPDMWDEPTESHQISFIPAAKVPSWFQEQGQSCPESLIQEWTGNPGKGIQITGTRAIVVRG